MKPRLLRFITGFSILAALASAPAVERGAQKDLIITFWCPPPATDENLARVAKKGFNLTWTPAEGLDIAAKHGLRSMLTSALLKPETLGDATKRAELDAMIERVKNHPALEAYHMTDEPGSGAFPGLGRLVAYLRERDPAHYAYIDLYPTYNGLYVDGQPMPLLNDVVALNKEIVGFGPALNKPPRCLTVQKQFPQIVPCRSPVKVDSFSVCSAQTHNRPRSCS